MLLPSQQSLQASPCHTDPRMYVPYFGNQSSCYSTQSWLDLCCTVTELEWVFLANHWAWRYVFSPLQSSACSKMKCLLFVFVYMRLDEFCHSINLVFAITRTRGALLDILIASCKRVISWTRMLSTVPHGVALTMCVDGMRQPLNHEHPSSI